MINANELRIGNLVISAKTDDVWEVDSIPNDAQITAKPIPLTGEWLERFGFEDNTKNIFGKTIIELDEDGEGYNVFVKQQNVDGAIPPSETILLEQTLQYVHQLQNLYFALTGEELKRKES